MQKFRLDLYLALSSSDTHCDPGSIQCVSLDFIAAWEANLLNQYICRKIWYLILQDSNWPLAHYAGQIGDSEVLSTESSRSVFLTSVNSCCNAIWCCCKVITSLRPSILNLTVMPEEDIQKNSCTPTSNVPYYYLLLLLNICSLYCTISVIQ